MYVFGKKRLIWAADRIYPLLFLHVLYYCLQKQYAALHETTTLTSVVSMFLRFAFGIILALYVSLSITIQTDKAFAIVVFSWKFLC